VLARAWAYTNTLYTSTLAYFGWRTRRTDGNGKIADSEADAFGKLITATEFLASGTISLGHPLGCSGARLVTTLVHEMKRRHHAGVATSPYGLATLCVGVGQGVALIVERL